jgi:hypothetical protein
MAQILASYAVGRIILHITAMIADHEFAWHAAGIIREFR